MILLLLTAAAVTDKEIHFKNVRSGQPSGIAPPTTTLINLNEGMKDIMKIVKPLEESGLFISSENKWKESKKQGGWFLGMLLDTSDASL